MPRSTISFDFGVGMATLPFASERQMSNHTVSTGVLSSGVVTRSLDALSDNGDATATVWNGAQIELMITFDTPTIVNRLRMEPDNHQGLAVDMLSSSPDGILNEGLGFQHHHEQTASPFNRTFTRGELHTTSGQDRGQPARSRGPIGVRQP